MSITFKRQIPIVAYLGLLIWSGMVSAGGWPSSVVGGWHVVANTSTGVLNITYQATSGQCRTIRGTIFSDTVSGFYCPDSGRIGFARKHNNIPTQFYSGNVSQYNNTLEIGGSFASWDIDINNGEYNFSATR